MSHYDTLGVARDASQKDISHAYRRLASRHHPDRAGGEGEQRMMEVNRAYEVLGDPAKREQYDRTGQDGNVATPEAKAHARLLHLFDQYLRQELEAANDLVQVFKDSVRGHMAEMYSARATAERKVARLKRQRDRLKGPDDLFRRMSDERLREQEQLVARITEDLQIDELVLKLLEDWKDVAPPAPPPPSPFASTQTGGLGSFFGGYTRA